MIRLVHSGIGSKAARQGVGFGGEAYFATIGDMLVETQ